MLVVGLLEHDSGKTWVGLALVHTLRRRGIRVSAFKPVAGHSAWHQYHTLVESKKRRMLVGEDALRYSRLLGLDPVLINPVDVLLAPPSPTLYPTLAGYLEALVSLSQQLVLARIPGREGGPIHYAYPGNIEKLPPGLRREIEELAQTLDAREGRVEELVSFLSSPAVEEVLEEYYERLTTGVDVLVVESFNNAATPYGRLLEHVDTVVLVAPGYIAVYDGDHYRKAVEEAYKVLGQAGLTTVNVVTRVKPLLQLYPPPTMTVEELAQSSAFGRLVEHVLQRARTR